MSAPPVRQHLAARAAQMDRQRRRCSK